MSTRMICFLGRNTEDRTRKFRFFNWDYLKMRRRNLPGRSEDTEKLMKALAMRIYWDGLYLPAMLKALRKEAIVTTLRRKRGNKLQTAKQLGMDIKTLYHFLNQYGHFDI